MSAFNLDKAIVEWRQQMIRSGVNVSETLDELESHLRDEIEEQAQGVSEEANAFVAAIQRIGTARALKNEFDKTNHGKIMKRIFIISAGIIGVLIGMGFVMPAVAQYRHEGAMLNNEPWLFLLGSLLTLAGLSAGILGARKRNA